MPETVYEFCARRIDGAEESLQKYRGRTLLVVNTASKCGFTPQYAGLEALYAELRHRGFEILAFPCNQFGQQEPGSAEEIQSFCDLNYQTSFPLFAKVDVNGESAHPLFAYLKKEAPGLLGTQGIKWNFTKFLVDSDGKVRQRFAPNDTPASIRGAIEPLLPS